MSALAFAGAGAALGLSGGLAPGPLAALVVRQSLTYGTREGMKVALVPVLTDGPLLIGAAVLADRLGGLDLVFAGISAVGAAFLAWLAWESWGAVEVSLTDAEGAPAGSVWRAVATNLLNPHPYLFWVAIGGPLVADAWDEGTGSTAAFLVAFFGCLCGAKAGMAWAVGAHRQRLGGPAYVWTMRALAVVLAGFAVGFAWEAVGRVG